MQEFGSELQSADLSTRRPTRTIVRLITAIRIRMFTVISDGTAILTDTGIIAIGGNR